MTTADMGWRESILTVLEDADAPLKYDTITQMIGERGLRSLTGATPADTVNSYLSQIIRPGHAWYDGRVRKVARGVFEIVADDNPSLTGEQEADLDDEGPTGHRDEIMRVASFGLYWEKDNVRLSGRNRRILGKQPWAEKDVNFADQMGVYILHNDRAVSYVGRTQDSLYARLKDHADSRGDKSLRWNKFSWFGFRKPDKNGQLLPMPDKVDPIHLITILEAVLIEALEPPVNGRRGDYMGEQYLQVPDPDIVASRDREFRLMVSDALRGE